MRLKVPESLQPYSVDDRAAVGQVKHNARCLDFLCKNGPDYGYFLAPSRLFCICKGEDESVARAEFEDLGLDI